MTQYFFEEIFSYPIEEFKKHLENDMNERIFFSGRYGMGKTSFLSKFFEKDLQEKIFGSQKYSIFKINPINYSISPNEDIIRHIKYDLIAELLRNGAVIEEIELSFLDTAPEFLKRNLDTVFETLIKMIPKVGKEITEMYDSLKELGQKILKFHELANVTDGDLAIDYLDNLSIKDGSVYENDIITRIITETIAKNKKQHSLLLVDDIDRLDPEHVFRILNVFAAHLDPQSMQQRKNKFGFDKIVIVGDFHNIRNIFYYRYGSNADFMGYIDKFYSSEIYHFDNKKAITKVLQKIFYSMRPKAEENEAATIWLQLYFQDSFLTNVLTLFIEKKFITLRNIMRLFEKEVNFHHEQFSFNLSHTEIYAWRIPIVFQLMLLNMVVGDFSKLEKMIQYCQSKKVFLNNNDFYFGSLLYILKYDKHLFATRSKEYQVIYQGLNLNIKPYLHFTTDRFERMDVQIFQTDKSLINFEPSPDLFWTALHETLELLNQMGYIN